MLKAVELLPAFGRDDLCVVRYGFLISGRIIISRKIPDLFYLICRVIADDTEVVPPDGILHCTPLRVVSLWKMTMNPAFLFCGIVAWWFA